MAWFRQPSWNQVEIQRKVLGVEHAIKYFSFWDVPRTFAFERGGNVYVLTSEFDADLDEYPDDYEVFVVSGIENLSMVNDWKSIEPLPRPPSEGFQSRRSGSMNRAASMWTAPS
jgi:hypothetical protein